MALGLVQLGRGPFLWWMGPWVVSGHLPEALRANAGSRALLPGSKTRDMEGGYSSDLFYKVPSGDQQEGRGSEPAASEDPGTLESSALFLKRCGDPSIGRSASDPGGQA